MGGKIQSDNFAHNQACGQAESVRQASVAGAPMSAAGQVQINRGDQATVDQFLNLSLAARASADEPAWSLPYGRATA